MMKRGAGAVIADLSRCLLVLRRTYGAQAPGLAALAPRLRALNADGALLALMIELAAVLHEEA